MLFGRETLSIAQVVAYPEWHPSTCFRHHAVANSKCSMSKVVASSEISFDRRSPIMRCFRSAGASKVATKSRSSSRRRAPRRRLSRCGLVIGVPPAASGYFALHKAPDRPRRNDRLPANLDLGQGTCLNLPVNMSPRARDDLADFGDCITQAFNACGFLRGRRGIISRRNRGNGHREHSASLGYRVRLPKLDSARIGFQRIKIHPFSGRSLRLALSLFSRRFARFDMSAVPLARSTNTREVL